MLKVHKAFQEKGGFVTVALVNVSTPQEYGVPVVKNHKSLLF